MNSKRGQGLIGFVLLVFLLILVIKALSNNSYSSCISDCKSLKEPDPKYSNNSTCENPIATFSIYVSNGLAKGNRSVPEEAKYNCTKYDLPRISEECYRECKGIK
jgi:hypothetical protein